MIPPLFARGLPAPSWPAFFLAQRARAAAAILARLAADMRRRPFATVESEEIVLPRNAASRFSSVSICRRIESACSNDCSDMCMPLDNGLLNVEQLVFMLVCNRLTRYTGMLLIPNRDPL